MNAIEVLESSDDQWYNGKGYTMHCVYMVLRLWKSNDNGFRCKASTVRDRRITRRVTASWNPKFKYVVLRQHSEVSLSQSQDVPVYHQGQSHA
jgi:hypothetical protein